MPDLIRWKGRVVPWVTRWSGEVNDELLSVGVAGGRVIYGDESVIDRDDHGVLWTRFRAGRKGTPEFKAVHPGRQRQGVLAPRCQTCGVVLRDQDALWPVKSRDIPLDVAALAGSLTTSDPPLCQRCAPLSAQLCPFLRRGAVSYGHAARVEPWGVLLDYYDLGGTRERIRSAEVAYADPLVYMGIARQLIVHLDGWTEVVRYSEGREVANAQVLP